MATNNSNNIHDIGVNAYIRNNVKSIHGNNIFIGDVSITDFDLGYFNSILESLKLKTEKDVIVFNTVCSMAYLDSYKKLANAVKKNMASEFEIAQYNRLSAISSSEDLRKYYVLNNDQLIYGLDSVVSFSDMISLNKVGIIKNLTEEENSRLNRVTPLHQNDLDKYNINVDKDFLYKFYSNYKVHLNKKSEVDSKRAVTVMVTNFLKDIYFTEPTETRDLINSISSEVFEHIESYKKTVPTCTTLFENLTKLYQKEEDKFGIVCLRDLDILEIILGSYFSMRDYKIIKGKTYGKKQ